MIDSKTEIEKFYRNDKWFTACLILSPIINVYAVRGIGLGFPFILVCLAIYAVKHIKNISVIQIDKKTICILLPMIFLIGSGLFSLSYGFSSVSKIVGRSIYIIVYTTVLLQSKNFFDFALAKKMIRIISVVVVLGTLLQIVAFYSTGRIIQLYIPGLSTSVENLNKIIVLDGGVFRPKSIFNESSHIAYFMSMCLAVELFAYKKNNMFWIIFDSIGLLLSVSGTGAALFVILMITYLISHNRIRQTFYILIGVIAVAIIVYCSGFWGHIQYSIGRWQTDTNRITSYSSIYETMNPVEKLFGVGIGNTSFRFDTLFESRSSFMSGFGRIMVEGGFICALVYIICYIRLIVFTKFPNKGFPLLFFALNFAENIVFGLYYPLILIWLYYDNEEIESETRNAVKYSDSYER